ncbi:MAG: hypothetical protein IJO71_05375 [Microbacterium sp.]|jgi:hypothetical protein|uniref:hypothetical protein n=1 Tax=Microbacterium sp. TaxID=51671 RepID=UPI0025E65744|nr:hypothetical protein [Microbacterium sp.]MBQ9916619.1 hypothetical protein [Microbacterium sp.]
MASIDTKELPDFEEQWPRWNGRNDRATRARFGVSPARELIAVGVQHTSNMSDDVDVVQRRRVSIRDSKLSKIRRDKYR